MLLPFQFFDPLLWHFFQDTHEAKLFLPRNKYVSESSFSQLVSKLKVIQIPLFVSLGTEIFVHILNAIVTSIIWKSWLELGGRISRVIELNYFWRGGRRNGFEGFCFWEQFCLFVFEKRWRHEFLFIWGCVLCLYWVLVDFFILFGECSWGWKTAHSLGVLNWVQVESKVFRRIKTIVCLVRIVLIQKGWTGALLLRRWVFVVLELRVIVVSWRIKLGTTRLDVWIHLAHHRSLDWLKSMVFRHMSQIRSRILMKQFMMNVFWRSQKILISVIDNFRRRIWSLTLPNLRCI